MAEQEYFKKALANFTYDTVSGDAIRHMADLGYNIKQIMDRLDFPTSYEKVRHTVWEHLKNTNVLLSEVPGSKSLQETISFVKEYDKYGKPSFRRVIHSEPFSPIIWKEYYFYPKEHGSLSNYLTYKWEQNNTDCAYISCDFGLPNRFQSKSFCKALDTLDEYQRNYILGLPWENKIFYHKLNRDMIEIASRLYAKGVYSGSCYFFKLEEKLIIPENTI